MGPWISQVVPAYAVATFGEDWLKARIAQHRVRVRFPNASPGHALPQSESGNADARREASEAGRTHGWGRASGQAGGGR